MGYEVDFLPVGEGEKSGDAIALRFGNLRGSRDEQTVVIIDGGFKETGEKLVEHVRHYYGTDDVDLAVSTHPDADHISGLTVVLEELRVGRLWMHQPWNRDGMVKLFRDGRVTDKSIREKLRKSLNGAKDLEELADEKGIPIIEPFAGTFDLTESLLVLGPTQEYYEQLLVELLEGEPVRAQKGQLALLERLVAAAREVATKIAESWDIETLTDEGETSPTNNMSTIILFGHENRRVLFTADAGIPALTKAVESLEGANFDLSILNLIQVPHHGSKRNVGPSLLDRLLGPRQPRGTVLRKAYVSASENGAPKHPSKKVTNAFKRRGAEVYATQGKEVCQRHDSPDRPGWVAATALPLYFEFEE